MFGRSSPASLVVQLAVSVGAFVRFDWTFRRRGSVPEGVGESSSAAGDSGAYGSDRNVENGGDLFVVEVGNVTEHEGHAVFLGESSESSFDQFSVLERVTGSFGSRIGQVFVHSLDVAQRLRAPSASTQLVEGGVGGDAVGPRGERRASVERIQIAGDRHQGVLGGVVGIGSSTEDPEADCMKTRVMATQEIVEGR
jgi:hypothetical protein